MLDTFLFLLQPAAGLPVISMPRSLLHCSRNTAGYYFSSSAIIAEDKKKAQKLALGPPHCLQKSRKEQTPVQLHLGCQQPFPKWRGTKATSAPLHPPKTCIALLFRAHVHFAHHCQLFTHSLKITLVHSSLPPLLLLHPLPTSVSAFPLSYPFPSPVLATHPASHHSLPPLLSQCLFLSHQNVSTYEQVKNHMEMFVTTCSLLHHRTGHIQLFPYPALFPAASDSPSLLYLSSNLGSLHLLSWC